MYLNLINIDALCEDLPEVKSPKDFEAGRKFNKDGLFSQQIFGPLRSFCCACAKSPYKGRNSREKACKLCGVDITSSEERRKRFAKIKLPFEIMNPIIYYIICSAKPSIKLILNNLLRYKAFYYIEDNNLNKVDEEVSTPKENMLIGLTGVKKLVEYLIEINPNKEEFQFIRDHFDHVTINNVLVIPPDFRPRGRNQDGVHISDEINQYYSLLIVRCNQMKQMPYIPSEKDEVYRTNFRHIQTSVLQIYDYVLGKMSKKKGLIRSNILGKRVDFSGRAVISPDPTLKLDECRIPYLMILEILKPQLSAYLVNRKIYKRYNQSTKEIDMCIQSHDYKLYKIVEEFCKDKYCVLNRQPTLHRLGVLGFKITIHRGNTVQIHPLVCAPYNADFDGDSIAVYIPITERSKHDVIDKIFIKRNLLNPTDLSLVPTPNQDIILGIFNLTR